MLQCNDLLIKKKKKRKKYVILKHIQKEYGIQAFKKKMTLTICLNSVSSLLIISSFVLVCFFIIAFLEGWKLSTGGQKKNMGDQKEKTKVIKKNKNS